MRQRRSRFTAMTFTPYLYSNTSTVCVNGYLQHPAKFRVRADIRNYRNRGY